MARPKHTQTVEPCQIESPGPLPTPPPPDEVRAWLDHLLPEGIKTTLQVAPDALFAACLHAAPYERTDQRQGSRNGSRQRDLLTRCGRVEDVQAPRDREGQFQPLVFERWQRLEAPLADALRQMYPEGVSARGVAAITTALCQEDLSASRMSRLNEELRTGLQQWRERPLTSSYPYVYPDAVYEAVNWGGAVTDLAMLVAVGVNEDGYREIIGVGSGDAESAGTWREFLRALKERGLKGVRLVISDAPSGLKRALRGALPLADWQRCVAHFERNILSHVSPSAQAEVGRTLSRLFQSETVKEARAQAEEFARAYGRAFPKAVEALQSGLEDALTFLKCPVQRQRLIRTNNGLERAFKGVRRRTKAVGVFIAGETSCVDLVSAALRKAHDRWQRRRYLDMSVLRELPKNEES